MHIEPGRVAVVTGAASGIGYALAAAAAGRGQHVVLSDVRADALHAAVGRLRASGAAVTAVLVDVSQPADIDRLAETAFALGSVQLLCSNAGIVVTGRAWELSAADWARVMNVNFMATVHLARAFVPRLIEARRPARLLVTGSMASVTARPGISPYVAAKHALLGLCESLNHELADAGAGVGVTLLLPGKVATGMSREDYPDAITPDEAAQIAFDAVAHDRPLAFTHADRIPEVEQRFAAIVGGGHPGNAIKALPRVPGMALTLSLVSEITRFYRQPSPTSDLGRHRDLSSGLPADPEALSAIVRGLLVHNYAVELQGLSLPEWRLAHTQTVGAEAILDNVFGLDPAPVVTERPVQRKMVGFCYHFALLHCALLRATGTPARIRCGFAGYFKAGWWWDHWVVEYWDGGGWQLSDPQIGRGDLTKDDFQDGPTAWLLCRDGASSPARYGNGELWGWDELRGSLINDVAALNKVEVAGWYWCDRLKVEPLDRPHDELDTSLDILSRLAATAGSAETIKESYDRYPEFHPPADAVAR